MTEAGRGAQPSTKRGGSRIPRFNTVEEEARFWDTHDTTEFEDELEEVSDVKFVPARPKKAITVRLEDETLDLIAREARQKGIGPSTLIRMWILEHLRESGKRPA